MGTHPIFESDFDCLTVYSDNMGKHLNDDKDPLINDNDFGEDSDHEDPKRFSLHPRKIALPDPKVKTNKVTPVASAPETYLPVGEVDNIQDRGFKDATVRRFFVRKVYAFLSIQLMVTAALIAVFSSIPEIGHYLRGQSRTIFGRLWSFLFHLLYPYLWLLQIVANDSNH